MMKTALIILTILSASSHVKSQEISTYKIDLLPSVIKIQAAGGIGVASLGIGWKYGNKWIYETEVLSGFLPRFESDESHFTLTLKQLVSPFKINIKDNYSFEPLTFGIFVSNVFGERFWIKQPDKYIPDYYDLTTGLRYNLFIGQRINYKLKRKSIIDDIGLYYELNVNDIYIVSDTQSTHLNVFDYINLSFGLRLKLDYSKE